LDTEQPVHTLQQEKQHMLTECCWQVLSAGVTYLALQVVHIHTVLTRHCLLICHHKQATPAAQVHCHAANFL
jgi:hypothetical protein